MIGTEKVSLLTMITSGMTAEIFGALPAFKIAHGGESGLMYSLSVYVFLALSAVAAIQALFAVLSFNKAAKRVRRALFLLGLAALIYTSSFAGCLNTNGTDVEPVVPVVEGVLALGAYSLEMISAVVAGVAMALALSVRISSNKLVRLEKKAKKTAAKINKVKGL